MENYLDKSGLQYYTDRITEKFKTMFSLKGDVGQGGALHANTVSEMIDKTRIYVYTGHETGYTSGHWYYWDGSSWTSGGLYNAIAVETDSTFTKQNMAADSKAVGLRFNELSNQYSEMNEELVRKVYRHNAEDILRSSLPFPSKTESGYSFSWDSNYDVCTFIGNTSADAYVNVVYSPESLPSGMKPGNRYYLQLNSSNPDIVHARIIWYPGGDFTMVGFTEDGWFTVPDSATGFVFRIQASDNLTNARGTVSPKILTAYSNAKLTEYVNSFTSLLDSVVETDEHGEYTTAEFIESFGNSFNDAPENTLICGLFGNTITDKPTDNFSGYVLTMSTGGTKIQLAVEYGQIVSGALYYRSIERNTWSSWSHIINEDELNSKMETLQNAIEFKTNLFNNEDGNAVFTGDVYSADGKLATEESVDLIDKRVSSLEEKTEILTNEDGNAVFTGDVYSTVNNSSKKLSTEEYVDSEVEDAVSDKIAFVEVEQLPTGADIKERTIYCVPDEEGGHDKFIYVPVQDKPEEECWEQFGGGGGGSVVLGVTEDNGVMTVDSLPRHGKDGINYYIPSLDSNGDITAYLHEIWVSDDNLQDGGKYYAIKMVGVDEAFAAIQDATSAVSSRVSTLEESIGSFGTRLGSAETDIVSLKQADRSFGTAIGFDRDENAVYLLDNNGDRLEGSSVVIPSGGGGGSTEPTNTVEISFQNSNPGKWTAKTVTDQEICVISITWSSIDKATEDPTGGGVLRIYKSGALLSTRGVDQGQVLVDVTEYLTDGENAIRISITDAEGNQRGRNYTIVRETLSISSTFNTGMAYSSSSPIQFRYTPNGNVVKTIHFIIDGNEVGTKQTAISGESMTYDIPPQSHGAHTIECYFDCVIDGNTVQSNTLYYEFACFSLGVATPIIISSFSETSVEQYRTVNITYFAYTPGNESSNVNIRVTSGGNMVYERNDTVGRSVSTFSYRCDRSGSTVVTFRSGDASKSISFTVTESSVVANAETDRLQLFLTSSGRSNNETSTRNIWEFVDSNNNTISAQLSNFNFVSDGWQNDADGNTVLRVKDNARVTIPFRPFMNDENNKDFKSTGKTIEIEFATRDVFDFNAPIISCMSGDRGLLVTPNVATLRSSGAFLNVRFKQDEHIRLSFVVTQYSEDLEENRFIISYVNGIATTVKQYSTGVSFAQLSPVGISIGSNDCTVDIYSIRIYGKDLSRRQVLNNWIADTQDATLMLDRYQRNQVFDGYGKIDINKFDTLLTNTPYMVVSDISPVGQIPDLLPQYKGNKMTVRVRYHDPMDRFRSQAEKKSFTAEKVQINVQGTSSQEYPVKNFDLQFKVKDSQSQNVGEQHAFMIGSSTFDDPNSVPAEEYTLTDDSMPFNRFVLKADYASSEGVNNAGLTDLYNSASPYRTKEEQENPRIRDGIKGIPIILFQQKSDSSYEFIGKYNFNLPKRAPRPYGYAGVLDGEVVLYDENGELRSEDDPEYNPKNMESWEWETNISKLLLFQSIEFKTNIIKNADGKLVPAWRDELEARFPSDEYENHDTVGELIEFVYSTWRDEATGNTLPEPCVFDFSSEDAYFIKTLQTDYHNDNSFVVTEETLAGGRKAYHVSFTEDTKAYRITRFRAGIGEIMEIDSAIFYYIFTELFLMTDSRCKNMFIGFKGSRITTQDCPVTGATYIKRKAVLEPYDMDTSLGINNQGEVVYGYNLEDLDHIVGSEYPSYQIVQDSEMASGRYAHADDPNADDTGVTIVNDVFNGQHSVLWCNIRDAFSGEIQEMYKSLRSSNKLSYGIVESMYQRWQSKWPEAIWNEDAWNKYILPVTNPKSTLKINENTGVEEIVPGAPYYEGLKKMQGAKTCQRRWWLYNRFQYMDSKWEAGDAIANKITFRAQSGRPVTITPYADLYPSMRWGAGTYYTNIRSENNVPAVINPPSGANINNLETWIYSPEQLKSIGDLSRFYVYNVNVAQGIRLQELIVGSGDAGYRNSNLRELTLTQNAMLRKLDARNCESLTDVDGLSQCISIQEVLLNGTKVKSIDTPNGGLLRKMLLPETVTDLHILNQPYLNDFSIASNQNLQTIIVTGEHQIDIKSLVSGATNLGRGRIENVNWELDNAELLLFLSGLDPDSIYDSSINWFGDSDATSNALSHTRQTDPNDVMTTRMKGYDVDRNETPYFYLSGNITVSTSTAIERAAITAAFAGNGDPTITWSGSAVETHIVTFVDENNTVICTQVVRHGESVIDPVNLPETSPRHIPVPTKHKTRTVTYVFSGWSRLDDGGNVISGDLSNIVKDTTFKTSFTSAARFYTVAFCYANGSHIDNQTYTVPANGNVSYTGDELLWNDPRNGSLHEGSVWIGFDKETSIVYSDDDNDLIEAKALFIDPTDQSTVTMATRPSSGIYYLYSDDPSDVSLYSLEDFYRIIYYGWASDSNGGDGYFAIGDRIKIIPRNNSIISDESIIMWLVDFDYYKLEDGSTFAKTLFHMKGALTGAVPMSYTTPVDGYGASTTISTQPTLRDRLNGFMIGDSHFDGIYDILPIHWKNMIKTVQVPYCVGMQNQSSSPEIRTSYDKLFLLSSWECGGREPSTDERLIYPLEMIPDHVIRLYTTASYKVKGLGNKSYDPQNPENVENQGFDKFMTRVCWWTRTQKHTGRTTFVTCATEGDIRYGYQEYDAKYTSVYVSFAFCI